MTLQVCRDQHARSHVRDRRQRSLLQLTRRAGSVGLSLEFLEELVHRPSGFLGLAKKLTVAQSPDDVAGIDAHLQEEANRIREPFSLLLKVLWRDNLPQDVQNTTKDIEGPLCRCAILAWKVLCVWPGKIPTQREQREEGAHAISTEEHKV